MNMMSCPLLEVIKQEQTKATGCEDVRSTRLAVFPVCITVF